MRMQRALSGSFCTESWGPPLLFRAAARSAALRCPSADSGGSLPSAGSTMSDVRRFHASVPRLLAEMPVHQLFDKFHAPEFHDLGVLFQSAVEEHADLPRSREHVRILDGRLIEKMVRAGGGVSFDHVQRVAMEISCAVEPGLIVETRGIND